MSNERVLLPGQAAHERHILRVLQQMPRRAYRIDPVLIPELIAWLTVIRRPYETLANQGWRGADPAERMRRKGEREYGKQMMRAIDAVAQTLLETRGVDDIDAALDEWYRLVLSSDPRVD